MSDSVSSIQHSAYEDLVRDSLKSLLWTALRIYAREPERGFDAKFNKRESLGNLWWVGRSESETVIQIDYLAHTTPLTILQDVDDTAVACIPHAKVFKSKSTVRAGAPSGPVEAAVQRLLSDSPEKPDAEAPEDEFVQYVVGEITHGGERSIFQKLKQLEKDCTFLTSRAQPMVTRVANLRVLDVVAVAVVASPSISHVDVFNYVNSKRTLLPMLYELFSNGRLVCVRDERTVSVLIRDMQESIALLTEEVREARRIAAEEVREARRIAAEERREERRIAAEEHNRLAAELREMFRQGLASMLDEMAASRVANRAVPESQALPLPTSPAEGLPTSK